MTIHEAAKYKAEFSRIFGVPLERFYDRVFISVVGEFSLDIVAFDDWLGTPEGVSCAQYVEKKYGKKGLSLIETLLVH